MHNRTVRTHAHKRMRTRWWVHPHSTLSSKSLCTSSSFFLTFFLKFHCFITRKRYRFLTSLAVPQNSNIPVFPRARGALLIEHKWLGNKSSIIMFSICGSCDESIPFIVGINQLAVIYCNCVEILGCTEKCEQSRWKEKGRSEKWIKQYISVVYSSIYTYYVSNTSANFDTNVRRPSIDARIQLQM